MLSISTRVRDGETTRVLAEPERDRLLALARAYNADGFRVLVVATREIPDGASKSHYTIDDERDLVVQGFLTFLDPPKETAGPALAALAGPWRDGQGADRRHEVVTAKICREVGWIPVSRFWGGRSSNSTTPRCLRLCGLRQRTIFAKLTPLQKSRVLTALQANGHTVGFLGDGINDAPALRDADVGISVDSGTDNRQGIR